MIRNTESLSVLYRIQFNPDLEWKICFVLCCLVLEVGDEGPSLPLLWPPPQKLTNSLLQSMSGALQAVNPISEALQVSSPIVRTLHSSYAEVLAAFRGLLSIARALSRTDFSTVGALRYAQRKAGDR
jgi:hypothetical protein